jgi:hypothetical protein
LLVVLGPHPAAASTDVDVGSREEQERWETGTESDSGGRALAEIPASRSCDFQMKRLKATDNPRGKKPDKSQVRLGHQETIQMNFLRQMASDMEQKTRCWTAQVHVILISAWVSAAPWVAVITARA